ncbi:hypothetical protein IGI04_042625 [Brassica rapa subsp. trilocularis]|uniref:Uncharacterized protein n=1 Tax=Brassica rapa subsp. trilocularis TaxID=1813537 RepID=A0ABQ7KHV6_BRACM|nr:hypothetical protein IGI04_042625 [Brassica rapa subsp. trilocularis]
MASPLGGLRNQPGSLIDPNTLVSYPCWSLSGVSGSQEVSSAHHLSKKRGRLEPLCGAMGRYLCVEAGLRSAGHEVVELLVQDIQAEDQPLCGAMGRFLCVEAGLRSAGHEVVELLVQGTQEEEGHHLCHEEGRLLPTFCGKSTACSKEVTIAYASDECREDSRHAKKEHHQENGIILAETNQKDSSFSRYVDRMVTQEAAERLLDTPRQ